MTRRLRPLLKKRRNKTLTEDDQQRWRTDRAGAVEIKLRYITGEGEAMTASPIGRSGEGAAGGEGHSTGSDLYGDALSAPLRILGPDRFDQPSYTTSIGYQAITDEKERQDALDH
jgi:hypothetical protein